MYILTHTHTRTSVARGSFTAAMALVARVVVVSYYYNIPAAWIGITAVRRGGGGRGEGEHLVGSVDQQHGLGVSPTRLSDGIVTAPRKSRPDRDFHRKRKRKTASE